MRKILEHLFFKSGLNKLRIVPSPDLRKKEGFSLIELLVAITIGGIVLTVVMTSYAAMAQTNLQLDIARQLQKEANFAVIRMADRVRNFSIENCKSDKLTIGQEKGEFEFLKNKGQLTMDNQPLFSPNIKVDEVSFVCQGVVGNSIKKSKNPAKLQPRVQIYLQVSSRKYPKISNWVQTTISSRIFE